MTRGALVRALLLGAAGGAALGLLAALGEVAWVAWSVRGAGFRPVLLLFAALLDGGVGLLVGLLAAAAWCLLRSRRPGRPAAEVAPVERVAAGGDAAEPRPPRPAANSTPPAARPGPRPLTRRAALRLALGIGSAGALGALTLAWVREERGGSVAGGAAPGRPGGAASAATTRQPASPAAAATAPHAPATATPPATIAPAATAGGRMSAPPNVLLVTLDTLRVDHIRAYGHPTVQTPTLDRLAAEGARFDLHMIHMPQTNPSHATILTGMYPTSNGVRVHMVDKLPATLDTLAIVFKGRGYRTAALYSWMSLDPQYCHFERGFDVYANVAPNVTPALNTPATRQVAAGYREAQEYLVLPKVLSDVTGMQDRAEEGGKGRANLTTDAAIAQLQQFRDGPFFLWVHYFDAHYPYSPPQPYTVQYATSGYRGPIDSSMETVTALQLGKLRPDAADLRELMGLYRGEVTFMDAQLGRLFETLDGLGLLDTTVVAVTADHGEAFGEHPHEIVGLTDFFHPHGLYNEEARSPLILRYPPRVRPGGVVTAPTQAIDLFPTLLELAAAPIPAQAQGASVLGLLDGREDGLQRAAFAMTGEFTFMSVTVPGWKLIRNTASGTMQLYDLRNDSAETRNLADARPDIREPLAARLQGWMREVGIA